MVLPTKYPLRATLSGVLIAIFIWGAASIFVQDESLRLATSYTGRLSALLFLIIFTARPLVDLYGPNRFGGLLRLRGSFGLILAGNHHVHMVILTLLLLGENAPLTSFILNPALYIYLLLVVMNITSFPSVKHRLKKGVIDKIHFVGLYALGIAFFETLVLSVIMGSEGGYFRHLYALLFFIALGIRIAAFLQNQRRIKSRQP